MKRYLVKTYTEGVGVTHVEGFNDLEAAKTAAILISLFSSGRARIYDNATGLYIEGIWEAK